MWMRVTRKMSDASYKELAWSERWEGPDGGLIACWERGREKSKEDPDLAAAATRGELAILPWKGGVDRATKAGQKFGSLFYLAMWQGLRGDPLDIDLGADVTLTCARTGMTVTYTANQSKYSQQV